MTPTDPDLTEVVDPTNPDPTLVRILGGAFGVLEHRDDSRFMDRVTVHGGDEGTLVGPSETMSGYWIIAVTICNEEGSVLDPRRAHRDAREVYVPLLEQQFEVIA